MRATRRIRSVVALAVMAWTGMAWGVITFTGPTSYIPHVDCGRSDTGYTDVTAFQWLPSGDLNGSTLWDSIMTQTAGEFPLQWGYQFSNAITGTLNVDKYEAFDDDSVADMCRHGVRMAATLNGVSGIPAGESLNWFQVYREYGDSVSRGHQPGDWTIDPSQREMVGGVEEDDAPFYYNQGEADILHPNATTWKYSDTPSDRLSDLYPHAGGIEFWTFLASWDGNYEATEGGVGSHVVTIYGGWSWGYTYYCPEPGSVGVLIGAGVVLMGRRR